MPGPPRPPGPDAYPLLADESAYVPDGHREASSNSLSAQSVWIRPSSVDSQHRLLAIGDLDTTGEGTVSREQVTAYMDMLEAQQAGHVVVDIEDRGDMRYVPLQYEDTASQIGSEVPAASAAFAARPKAHIADLEDRRRDLHHNTGAPLHIGAEVRAALGNIAFPRLQADGSMELGAYRVQWNNRTLTRIPEFVGIRYCCWTRPLRKSDTRHWLNSFFLDLVASPVYFVVALCCWLLDVRGAAWEWWILLMGIAVGLAVAVKNVAMFYQQIAPLINHDTLSGLIAETMDGVKQRIRERVHQKLGVFLVTKLSGQTTAQEHGAGSCLFPTSSTDNQASQESRQHDGSEAKLERFVTECVLGAMDKVVLEVTTRPKLSRLPPWVCRTRLRFLAIFLGVFVFTLLSKSAVDTTRWPRGDRQVVPTPEDIPAGASDASYACWDIVCTAKGEEGYCEGSVFYGRKYVDVDYRPMTKLEDVKVSLHGPWAQLDVHGHYLCHGPAGFPPVDYDMHCFCDHEPIEAPATSWPSTSSNATTNSSGKKEATTASRSLSTSNATIKSSGQKEARRLAMADDNVVLFGFKVLFGNIAISILMAMLASWPPVRWFSNFTLAHMEQELWRQVDHGFRQMLDINMLQNMIDEEIEFELENAHAECHSVDAHSPEGHPPESRPEGRHCCVM